MESYVRVTTVECSWMYRSSQHTGSEYLWMCKTLYLIFTKNNVKINQNLLYCDLGSLK